MPRADFSWVFMVCAMVSLIATPGQAATQDEWVRTGSPTADGPLIVLADGTTLLFGSGTGGVQQYHPETGNWTVRGTRPSISFDTLTSLPSGRVLMSGGPTAAVYDPMLDTATATGPMQAVRSGGQTTSLASGRVVVSGGRGTNTEPLASVEIYDPATNLWAPTGGLNQPRFAHASIRLPNGKVLVAGGIGVSGALASAEIYDPTTGTWTPTGAMDRPRAGLKAVALKDGRILVAGADSVEFSSEVYDAASGVWSATVSIGPISLFRVSLFFEALVVLGDGRPLMLIRASSCSGFGCGGPPVVNLAGSRVFNLTTNIWVSTDSLTNSRIGSLAVLPDGRALLASAEAQLFRPDNTSPRLTASPLPMDFGRTAPGISAVRALTLQNTGGATLVGTATSLVAPFTLTSASPFALAPGASTTIGVQFTPPVQGAFAGTIQLTSSGNWFSVPLSGAAGEGVFISGVVADITGAPVADVNLNLTGAATGTTSTNAMGQYRFLVPPNNGYNVSPASPGLAFTPSSRVVVIGAQDVGAQDFTATSSPGHIGVFRAASWSLDVNGNQQWDGCSVDACPGFGLATDKPVAGDWAGTGKARIGVFRDGLWSLDFNGNGLWDGCNVDRCRGFGLPGDEPVAGDWTASGPEKIGVFRNGAWFLDLNGNGLWDGCGTDACFGFGLAGDLPVVGDWTGTGRARVGVFRNGHWSLDLNGNGLWDGCAVDGCLGFGLAGDRPVVGDWTGTGNAKIGVFRDGVFYLDLNGNGLWDGCVVDGCVRFGLRGDHPVAAFW